MPAKKRRGGSLININQRKQLEAIGHEFGKKKAAPPAKKKGAAKKKAGKKK